MNFYRDFEINIKSLYIPRRSRNHYFIYLYRLFTNIRDIHWLGICYVFFLLSLGTYLYIMFRYTLHTMSMESIVQYYDVRY